MLSKAHKKSTLHIKEKKKIKITYLYIVPIPPPFVVIMIRVVNDIASSFCCNPKSFAVMAAELSLAGLISLPPVSRNKTSLLEFLLK